MFVKRLIVWNKELNWINNNLLIVYLLISVLYFILFLFRVFNLFVDSYLRVSGWC